MQACPRDSSGFNHRHYAMADIVLCLPTGSTSCGCDLFVEDAFKISIRGSSLLKVFSLYVWENYTRPYISDDSQTFSFDEQNGISQIEVSLFQSRKKCMKKLGHQIISSQAAAITC